MADIESPQNTASHENPHHNHDSNEVYKQKYNKLKQLLIAITCLLCGLLIGHNIATLINHFTLTTTDMDTTETIISSEMIPIYTPYTEDHNKSTSASTNNTNQQPLPPKIRPNNAECSTRRCCHFRDGITQQMLPPNLNCYELTDSECGKNDDFCEWNCYPPLHDGNNIKRTFRNISFFEGQWEEPEKTTSNIVGSESFTNCLEDGKLLSVDDCGVEYEEELNFQQLSYFCKFHEVADASFVDGTALSMDDHDEEDIDLYLHRRLTVLGADGRIKVSSTTYPWSTALYLNYDGPTGTHRCTATMISPRWGITSAHCLWGHGDWYNNVRVYTHVRSCSDKTSGNRYDVDIKTVFSAYKQAGRYQPDHDIGLFRLKQEPNIGYMGFGYREFSGAYHLNVNQFPADKPDCTLWRQYCPFNEWQTFVMKTSECDIYSGSSGSAWYRYWSATKETMIVGIQSGQSNTYNTATRITAGKYKTICSYVERDHPGHCNREHDADWFV